MRIKIYQQNCRKIQVGLSSFPFLRRHLLALVSCPTGKIFNGVALKVEIREKYNLLLFKLTELLRYDHVRMWI